jgi:hypothetical protein
LLSFVALGEGEGHGRSPVPGGFVVQLCTFLQVNPRYKVALRWQPASRRQSWLALLRRVGGDKRETAGAVSPPRQFPGCQFIQPSALNARCDAF